MHSSPIKPIILHLIAILFVIFNINSVQLAGIDNIIPLFDLMMIYYFAVYREGVFSYWFLFVLGIWADCLNGIPSGITSLAYLIVVRVFVTVNDRMAMKDDFEQILKQFIVFAFLILFLKWIFLSIYYSKIYNIISPLAQLILSSIAYIIMHKFFDYLNQKLIEESGA